VNDFIAETKQISLVLEREIQEKIKDINKNKEEVSMKYQQMLAKNEDVLEDVKRINVKLAEVRNQVPPPKEPIFEPFPDLPYVPELPKTTGLDSKGKKKKDLKGSDVKTLLQQIELHELDNVDWNFGERWPTSSQYIILKQGLDKRNHELDEERAREQATRDNAYEIYTISYQRWEIEDRQRRNEYEKLKKESRKIFLKLDCMTERQEMLLGEVRDYEHEEQLWLQLLEFHQQCLNKIFIIKSKQYLENIRQNNYIKNIQKKLLLLIDARRRAYDLPLSAKNEIEYEIYCEKSSVAIRTLRYEIIDCKENLIHEGIRLRRMREEENQYLMNELTRVKMMKEMLNQKICIDHIVKRHKYEVFSLLEDLEKLKIYEADRDDCGGGGGGGGVSSGGGGGGGGVSSGGGGGGSGGDGISGINETIDGLGERYLKTKEWTSIEIMKLKSTISIILNKIKLTEGMKRSAYESQRSLFEVMSLKYATEMTPVRDSWCENSDYERGQQQLYNIIQWITQQRHQMIERENQYELIKERAKIELLAYQDYMTVMNTCHQTETSLLTESSQKVLEVIKEQMIKKDQETKLQILNLEKNLTNISKECHELREEKYQQALSYNTKVDSLLSLVGTLQTTLEHQSSVMEYIQEEKESIVLKTRLASDRLKYQLRLERKHSANLLFIIHTQRAVIQRLNDTITSCHLIKEKLEQKWKEEKRQLRIENWEQLYVFSHLNTDIDDLFEFFITRISNLAGTRKITNEKLRENGAAVILSAFCQSPRPLIRKYATKALGSYGWDGYTETRIILWDSMMFWKNYKEKILSQDLSRFDHMKEHFIEHGNFTTLEAFDEGEGEGETEGEGDPGTGTGGEDGHVDKVIEKKKGENDDGEYVPLPNASIRTIIKEKRQWALRAQRKKEGPNLVNMKSINIADGIVQTLVKVCQEDGKVDWEIVRNASLALSIASYEESNIVSMASYKECVHLIVSLLSEGDPEIQTHGATVLANLCYENERSQLLFGKEGAISLLINLCHTTTIPDLLEAITAALTNLTCLCDVNCLKFLECHGVQEMVVLLTTVKGENFLNTDQFDEIQANASEILANISRFDCELTIRHFNVSVIDVLILSCASSNKMVKKHSPLILGNISQNDWCRREIGTRGGIESLFLGLEDQDRTIQGNILWALCNLMWYPPNQERAGRFISEIIPFLSQDWLPVQTNAAILIANILYYNNNNRIRFLEYEGSMELLIYLIKKKKDWGVIEACLRAVLSLSYIDAASLWLGTEGDCLPIFLEFLQPPVITNQSFCSRYSLEILNNMCVHHTIRRNILDLGGTDCVVTMLGHDELNVQQTAIKVLELLEDVTPLEVLTKTKNSISLERMINLLSSQDPLVRAMAAESIGEELWKDAKKQGVINELHGIESLLMICKNPTESVNSVLPALWSLRNCLHGNATGQMQFHTSEGIQILLNLFTNTIHGTYKEQTEKIMESLLLCLISAISEHEQNSRRLLQRGLDLLLDVSEEKIANRVGVTKEVRRCLSLTNILSLSKSLLTMLGPYNYVVCHNCHKKQPLQGTQCLSCGNIFYLDQTRESLNPSSTSALTGGGATQKGSKSTKKSEKGNLKGKAVLGPIATFPSR
jgi:hypothetical protein